MASNGDQGDDHKEDGTESPFFSTKDSKSTSCIPHMGEVERTPGSPPPFDRGVNFWTTMHLVH